jgi:hypothetical protein
MQSSPVSKHSPQHPVLIHPLPSRAINNVLRTLMKESLCSLNGEVKICLILDFTCSKDEEGTCFPVYFYNINNVMSVCYDFHGDILKVKQFYTLHCIVIVMTYEVVSKSFRTGRLEEELQMIQLSAIRYICIAILWVSLISFAAITLCVVSQRVFIVVSAYLVIHSDRKIWKLSYTSRGGPGYLGRITTARSSRDRLGCDAV